MYSFTSPSVLFQHEKGVQSPIIELGLRDHSVRALSSIESQVQVTLDEGTLSSSQGDAPYAQGEGAGEKECK